MNIRITNINSNPEQIKNPKAVVKLDPYTVSDILIRSSDFIFKIKP